MAVINILRRVTWEISLACNDVIASVSNSCSEIPAMLLRSILPCSLRSGPDRLRLHLRFGLHSVDSYVPQRGRLLSRVRPRPAPLRVDRGPGGTQGARRHLLAVAHGFLHKAETMRNTNQRVLDGALPSSTNADKLTHVRVRRVSSTTLNPRFQSPLPSC